MNMSGNATSKHGLKHIDRNRSYNRSNAGIKAVIKYQNMRQNKC